MPKTPVQLAVGKTVRLTFPQIARFTRLLLLRRTRTIAKLFGNLCVKLGGPRHAFSHSPSRVSNFVAKGFANPEDGELDLLKEIHKALMDGLSIPARVKLANQAKRDVPDDEDEPQAPDGTLRAEGANATRSDLATLYGDYLILRRLTSPSRVVVYHMRIWRGKGRGSANYLTTATLLRHGAPTVVRVTGSIHRAAGFLFAHGSYGSTNEIRTTILEPIDDLSGDLCGIRLGVNRIDRRPAAYRIWCVRLPHEGAKQDWSKVARVYGLRGGRQMAVHELVGYSRHIKGEAHEPFTKHVPYLQEILSWLGEAAPVELYPPSHSKKRPKSLRRSHQPGRRS